MLNSITYRKNNNKYLNIFETHIFSVYRAIFLSEMKSNSVEFGRFTVTEQLTEMNTYAMIARDKDINSRYAWI